SRGVFPEAAFASQPEEESRVSPPGSSTQTPGCTSPGANTLRPASGLPVHDSNPCPAPGEWLRLPPRVGPVVVSRGLARDRSRVPHSGTGRKKTAEWKLLLASRASVALPPLPVNPP